MRVVRRALWLLHIALLAFASYIAVAAAFHAPVSALRVTVAAALVAVAAAYAVTLLRRGFTSLAPFLFLASFALIGYAIDISTRALAKHAIDLETIAQLILATALATGAWYWTTKRSRPLTPTA